MKELSVQLFARQSTGLVREMSPWSAMVYNLLTIGFTSFAFIYFSGAVAFPKANLPVGLLIGALLSAFPMITNVLLGSSLPRSGGDYLFQTRAGIPAWWALMANLTGLGIWSAFTAASIGWLFVNLAIAPWANLFAVAYHSAGLRNFGAWAVTPGGSIVLSLALWGFAGLMMFRGIRWFVRYQWWLMTGTALGIIVMFGVLLSHSHAQFVAAFNSFVAAFGSHVTYQQVVGAFHPSGLASSLSPTMQTLAMAAIAWTALCWSYYSVYQNGEIRHAGSVRNQAISILGSLVIYTVVMVGMAALIDHVLTYPFVAAIASAQATGSPALPFAPFFDILVASLSIASPVVLILVPLGFFANALQLPFNSLLQMSRLLFAISMDRLLPDAFARVDERFHVPTWSIVVPVLAGAVIVVVYFLIPNFSIYVLGYIVAAMIPWITTMVAAVMFPYKAPRIYQSSPIAGYKVLGAPLIVVTGVIGLIFELAVFLIFLTQPGLGFSNLPSWFVIGGGLLVWGIYYLLWQRHQARQGFNLSLAMQEIPPE